MIRPAASAAWVIVTLFASATLAQAPAESEAPEEPASEPAEESADEPAEESADEPADEPAEEPASEPSAEPTEEPASEPASEPAAAPTAEREAESDPDRERCERDIRREELDREAAAREAEAAKAREVAGAQDEDRKAFEEAVARYAEAALDYQSEAYGILKLSIDEQKDWINNLYGKQAKELDTAERQRRMEAIERFEHFIERYPDHPEHTPDAMFRLAELYFERSAVRLADDEEKYDERRMLYARGKLPDDPSAPEMNHADGIKIYKQLIARFGNTFRYTDAVYYLLGYVLAESMDEEGAIKAWTELTKRFPKSDHASEAFLRIGELHFDVQEYPEAIAAYKAVLNYPKSSYYDKALYKLAWSYFDNYEYDPAINTFKRLIAYYGDGAKASGQGLALREEAIEYLARSLTEDDWDDDGEKDPDAGVGRGLGYLNGGTSWEREVIVAYANALFGFQDVVKFPEAVAVYEHLIKTDPMDAKGPDYLRNIIQIHDDMGEIDKAAEARKRMAVAFGPKSKWWKKHASTQELEKKMAQALEATLRNRAEYHHEKAQNLNKIGLEQDDDAMLQEARSHYAKAASAYREYLELYPDEPASYRLTFQYAEALWYSDENSDSVENKIAAGPIYQKVATDPHQTEWRVNAAYGMTLSYEVKLEFLGKSGQLDPRFIPSSDWSPPEEADGGEQSAELKQITAVPIPKPTKIWIAAADFFIGNDMQLGGSREQQGLMAYKAAEIFYRANDFKEARRRYRQIISCYPGDDVAAGAIANIINSYKAENDWANLEKWADRADRLNLGNDELQKAIRKEIKLFKLTSMFNRADALYKNGKFIEAAREFERLANENPDAKFADRAFYNAAMAFKSEKYYDSAARVLERLVTDPRYKDSEFAEQSVLELAQTNEIFFNFDEAISGFQTLYDRYPEGKNRKYALNQIARLLKAAGKLGESAEAFERYLEQYPDEKGSAGILYQTGELYERIGDVKEQERIWKQFLEQHSETEGMNVLVVEALGKLSDIALAKKKMKPYKKYRARILEEYVARNLQPTDDPQKNFDTGPARKVAAKAQFQIVEETFERYNKVRVKSTKQKKQGETIETKKTMLLELQKQYDDLGDYQSFEWLVAGAYRIGNLYQEFAQMIYKLPEPRGLDDDEMDMYITQIEDLGLQFENIAIQKYEEAVKVSRRLKVTNDWAKEALKAINKFKPEEYPLFRDEKSKTVFEPTFTLDDRAPQGR